MGEVSWRIGAGADFAPYRHGSPGALLLHIEGGRYTEISGGVNL